NTETSLMVEPAKTAAASGKDFNLVGMNAFSHSPIATVGGISLGIKDEAKAGPKEEVNPDKITPTLPETKEPIKVDDAAPASLPLGATVTVLESDRTVQTNPQDGSYSLVHPAGSFTVLAESYGYHPEEQAVNLEDGELTEANFVLEESAKGTVSWKITNEDTVDAIEDATILLEEDANVEPVHSDENGNYSLTAYEGEYTLKVMARDFH